MRNEKNFSNEAMGRWEEWVSMITDTDANMVSQ